MFIGDALPAAPATLDEAVEAATVAHGAKAGRMLRRFAERWEAEAAR